MPQNLITVLNGEVPVYTVLNGVIITFTSVGTMLSSVLLITSKVYESS